MALTVVQNASLLWNPVGKIENEIYEVGVLIREASITNGKSEMKMEFTQEYRRGRHVECFLGSKPVKYFNRPLMTDFHSQLCLMC